MRALSFLGDPVAVKRRRGGQPHSRQGEIIRVWVHVIFRLGDCPSLEHLLKVVLGKVQFRSFVLKYLRCVVVAVCLVLEEAAAF